MTHSAVEVLEGDKKTETDVHDSVPTKVNRAVSTVFSHELTFGGGEGYEDQDRWKELYPGSAGGVSRELPGSRWGENREPKWPPQCGGRPEGGR